MNIITYLHKDITTVDYGIVAHGVNCQGVMGSGVAKAIKNKWPEIYESFLDTPKEKRQLGYINFVHISYYLWVLNLYTQEKYGNDGKIYASSEGISEALTSTFKFANKLNLPINMPKIGCGLGGLDWETDVKPIVESLSDEYVVDVNIYEI